MEEEANALLSIQQSQFTSMISHDKWQIKYLKESLAFLNLFK